METRSTLNFRMGIRCACILCFRFENRHGTSSLALPLAPRLPYAIMRVICGLTHIRVFTNRNGRPSVLTTPTSSSIMTMQRRRTFIYILTFITYDPTVFASGRTLGKCTTSTTALQRPTVSASAPSSMPGTIALAARAHRGTMHSVYSRRCDWCTAAEYGGRRPLLSRRASSDESTHPGLRPRPRCRYVPDGGAPSQRLFTRANDPTAYR